MLKKPEHLRSRSTLFTVLCAIVVPGNLVFAYLNYVIWNGGGASASLYESLVQSPFGLVWIATGSGAFSILGTAVTYILSLDPHRVRRPVKRVVLLAISFAAALAGYLLGEFHVSPDNIPAFLGAGIGCVAFAAAVLFVERAIGAAASRAADKAFSPAHPGGSLALARTALAFSPGNSLAETAYGLAQESLGEIEFARPYLEAAYARGERSPRLLKSLVELHDLSGNRERAAETMELLRETDKSPETFARLISLWRETGQKDKILAELQKLPPEERKEWNETIVNLLFERKDAAAIKALARELEQDGPPFQRARSAYLRLLELEPGDTESIEALAALTTRAGDAEATAMLLERLAELKPGDPALLRRLVAHYRAQKKPQDLLRPLAALVESGQATLGEKLEVMEHHSAHGENTDVEKLVTSDPELRGNDRALATWAGILSDSGRHAEALEQIAAARELEPGTEIRAELTALETSIRARILSKELSDFGTRVKADPKNLDLRFEYLDRLVAAGSSDRVVVELEEILTADPNAANRVLTEMRGFLARHGRNFRLRSYMTDIAFRERDWNRVHELYEELAAESLDPEATRCEGALKILREEPAHRSSLLVAARHKYQEEDMQAALAYLDRYREAGGEWTQAVQDMEFEAAWRTGDRIRARKAGEELLAQRPGDKKLMVRLAEMHGAEANYTAALDYLKQVQEKEPDDRGLRQFIKDYEEKRKRARMEEIRGILETDPQNRTLYEELGDLCHDFGLFNEAIVAYQKAALGDPTQNVARAKLGYILARKGMFADAEEAFNETELSASQPAPEQAQLKPLLFNAADLMEDDGHEDQRALALFKRIFRVDAGYGDVVARIERLQHAGDRKRGR